MLKLFKWTEDEVFAAPIDLKIKVDFCFTGKEDVTLTTPL
jgi:hypothetical protein